MSFTAVDFYALADELILQSKGDDAKLRSGISRAYYGALISARDAKKISTVGTTGHSQLINTYRAGSFAEKVIGDSLADLKKLREVADYEPKTPCPTTNGTLAITYASKILKGLGITPPKRQFLPTMLPATTAPVPKAG